MRYSVYSFVLDDCDIVTVVVIVQMCGPWFVLLINGPGPELNLPTGFKRCMVHPIP